jgi:hypothetical protein
MYYPGALVSRIKELERATRLVGLSGAMITEYPLEDRRYNRSTSRSGPSPKRSKCR